MTEDIPESNIVIDKTGQFNSLLVSTYNGFSSVNKPCKPNWSTMVSTELSSRLTTVK